MSREMIVIFDWEIYNMKRVGKQPSHAKFGHRGMAGNWCSSTSPNHWLCTRESHKGYWHECVEQNGEVRARWREGDKASMLKEGKKRGFLLDEEAVKLRKKRLNAK